MQVRSRFQRWWVDGFEVAGVDRTAGGEMVVVRRLSDRSLVPVGFPPEDVRPDPRLAQRAG